MYVTGDFYSICFEDDGDDLKMMVLSLELMRVEIMFYLFIKSHEKTRTLS